MSNSCYACGGSERCSNCDGSGWDRGMKILICPDCGGTGSCPVCGGRGGDYDPLNYYFPGGNYPGPDDSDV